MQAPRIEYLIGTFCHLEWDLSTSRLDKARDRHDNALKLIVESGERLMYMYGVLQRKTRKGLNKCSL